ncbi:hypothetical protein PV08_07853 [Exophiala spinifera]|uniref:RBR-type E3 ubiquitin transferase n=1 Tax=Exophiala spinifera TaxID=91928 RepID=A0A0D1YJE2_9EURO|nr:uncharacterized protein PV08_07853 [Exophiala spinifera]KIW15066.1 hypothetical protein PV08_07853 [Exophiala spinifera]
METSELRSCEGWTGKPIPEELRLHNEDESLPPKLKDILTWSLNVTNKPTKITPSNPSAAAKEALTGSETSGFTQPLAQTSPSEAASSATSVGSSQYREEKDSGASRRRIMPGLWSLQNTSKRPYTPQSGRHGILESTRDLLTAFRQKAEKTGQLRARSEVVLVHDSNVFECTGCFEEFRSAETTKLPCGHSYCKACLTTLIMTALQNESNYPPKCCLSEIPLSVALQPLDAKQQKMYKNKAAEYSIPAQERWYCPNVRCSKWIPPANLRRTRHSDQKCPYCSGKICSICRGSAHGKSVDCPQDFGLEATISLAELEGWRRCHSCRALVERASGCRHMTCKCGSQFCYVCGAKWRTCGCNEVDEVNRQADLRRRRVDRQVTIDAEAEELARTVAQVEALERREAADRQREQAQQEAERRRQEAQLTRLEEERRQEEASRRLEEERLEREYRLALRESILDTCNAMQSALINISQTQKQALDSRHLQATRALLEERNCELAKQRVEAEELQAKLKSNIDRRTAFVQRKHRSDVGVFTHEQDELEDDLFLEIRMHLHGKSDKEARECRLHEKFRNQRKDKLQELLKKHEMEMKTLNVSASSELDVVKRASDTKIAMITTRYANYFEAHRTAVAADLAWFQHISERRHNMVAYHTRLVLAAVEADEEPVGLTEEQATAIGPFMSGHSTPLQQDDRLVPSPTPSPTVTPTPSLVELAATSNRLLSVLEPQPKSTGGADAAIGASANQSLMNRAGLCKAGQDQSSAGVSRISEDSTCGLEAGQSIRRYVMAGGPRTPRRPNSLSSRRYKTGSRSGDNIPTVPELPARCPGGGDLLSKMPGAFPATQMPRDNCEAQGSSVQASPRHVYQRDSLAESTASVTGRSTAPLSPVSASDYSCATSPGIIGTLSKPVTDAIEPLSSSSSSSSLQQERRAIPVSTSHATPLRPYQHARGTFSLGDLRAALTGSSGVVGGDRARMPKYTLRGRLQADETSRG